MRRLDQQPRHGEQAECHQRLHAALELAHAPAHFINPLHRIVQADRQHHGCQAETVAQLVGLLDRAQVDRHHGANLLAADVIAKGLQVSTNCTGNTTQQHVVDRAVQGLAHSLDFIQRNRIAPRHAFAQARDALETCWRVVGHQRQRGRVAHHPVGHARQIHRTRKPFFHALLRLHQHVDGAGRAAAGTVDRLHCHVGQWFDQGVGDPVLGPFHPVPKRLARLALGRQGATVHQGLRDRDQRNAVGDAMVDPHHHRRAALVFFNQVKLPQRPALVERRDGQFGQPVLQRLLLAALRFARQRFQYNVVADIEIPVAHPVRSGGVLDHTLREAGIFQQALFDTVAQVLVADARLEHPYTDDHHQVGR